MPQSRAEKFDKLKADFRADTSDFARIMGVSTDFLKHMELGDAENYQIIALERKGFFQTAKEYRRYFNGGDFQHIRRERHYVDPDGVEAYLGLLFEHVPEDTADLLQDLARKIPDQNAAFKFVISDSGKLTIKSSPVEENDYQTIFSIRDELLAEGGPLEILCDKYSQNLNRPQAARFAPLVRKYLEELSREPDDINFVVLFSRGSQLFDQRAAAERLIEAGEWPEFDEDEKAAINAVCSLHGPLIMASSIGRKIVNDARSFEITAEEFRKEEDLFEEFGQAISDQTDILEPRAAGAMRDLTVSKPNDSNPARTQKVRLIVTASALSVFVGSVMWFSASGYGVFAVAGGAFLWEAAKKTKSFKTFTDSVAQQTDWILEKVEDDAVERQKLLQRRILGFVKKHRELFLKVSALRPEFEWARRALAEAKKLENGEEGL